MVLNGFVEPAPGADCLNIVYPSNEHHSGDPGSGLNQGAGFQN